MTTTPRRADATATASDEGWRSRLVSAGTAASAVPPGSTVYVGSSCATPRTVVRALEEQPLEHLGLRLVHHLTDGVRNRLDTGTNFDHRTIFVAAELADLVREVQPHGVSVDYVPMSLTDLPASLRTGRLRLDVAVVQVTPPGSPASIIIGSSRWIPHAT